MLEKTAFITMSEKWLFMHANHPPAVEINVDATNGRPAFFISSIEKYPVDVATEQYSDGIRRMRQEFRVIPRRLV